MKIAIMQPYYYPYAGYFRLFAASDLFVIYDCVQWNRRGRVHRREVKGKWETLPILKTDRESTRIVDLQWQDGNDFGLPPVDYIINTMGRVCCDLDLHFNCVRSSGMGIGPLLKGQERIIAICKKLGASEYINSPGGLELYDEDSFSKEGIKLTFLPEWRGSHDSMLERLVYENPEDIRAEIYGQI